MWNIQDWIITRISRVIICPRSAHIGTEVAILPFINYWSVFQLQALSFHPLTLINRRSLNFILGFQSSWVEISLIFLRRDILVFTNRCILFYPLNCHKPSLSIFNPLMVAIILLTINNTLLFWGVFCQGGLLYCFLFCIPSIKLSPICIAWVYLFEMHKNHSFEKFEIKPANAGDIPQFRLS